MSDKPLPPLHLVGAMLRAHRKATYAISRAHHARGHRPTFYRHLGTNHKFAACKNRWTTAHDKWQKRFQQACNRLGPYDVWSEKVELAP